MNTLEGAIVRKRRNGNTSLAIPSYTVHALGNSAWYVECWPVKFQPHDDRPSYEDSLQVKTDMANFEQFLGYNTRMSLDLENLKVTYP